MSRRRPVAALLLAAALAAAVAVWLLARGPGRTVYLGGPILTLDAENRVVEALAVDGERIAALGDAATLRAWADRHGARVVDLEGRALLPGFIDAHGHFPGEGIFAVHVDLRPPPMGEVDRIETLVARLAARAAKTGRGEWIIGVGYDDTLLAERRHPTRADLDRASTEHPIGIWHVSGHLAVANGAALEALGYGPRRRIPRAASSGAIRAAARPTACSRRPRWSPCSATSSPACSTGSRWCATPWTSTCAPG